VESWCGDELASAARDALAKIDQVLPRRLADRLAGTALFVPDFGWTLPGAELLADLRTAIRTDRTLRIGYRDAKGDASDRVIRPLGIFFWGAVATLVAWCELREDFRNFRIDRIESLVVLNRTFVVEPGRSLQDYYRAMADRFAIEAEDGG